MLDTDRFNTAWKALTHVLQSDSRLTPDEQAGIAAVDVVLDAHGNTSTEEDQLVLQVMKRLMGDAKAFYNP